MSKIRLKNKLIMLKWISNKVKLKIILLEMNTEETR